MKVIDLTILALLLASIGTDAACSFTKSFGDGTDATYQDAVSFCVAPDATTTCRVDCDGGVLGSLALKYGRTATPIIFDGRAFFANCRMQLSIDNDDDTERTLGYYITVESHTNVRCLLSK